MRTVSASTGVGGEEFPRTTWASAALSWHLRLVRFAAASILVAIAAVGGITIASRLASSEPGTEIFGHPVLVVTSGSMEPTIPVGAILLLDKVTPVETSRLRSGDIVTFRPVSGAPDELVTHRIVDVRESPSGIVYVTKGDANPSADLSQLEPSRIVGVYSRHFVLLGRLLTGFTRWPVIALVVSSLLLAQFGLERRPVRGTLNRKHTQT